MATAILPQPAPSAPVDLPLAQEISDLEGIGLKTALVLAELYRDDLMAYAEDWDVWAAESANIHPRNVCPQCGAALECRQAYVGGRGYVYIEVCGADRYHYSKRVE